MQAGTFSVCSINTARVKNWIKTALQFEIPQTIEVSSQQQEQGVLGGKDSRETKTDSEIKRHLKTNPFFEFLLCAALRC